MFKILDPERTRVVFNSAWLAPLRAEDVIRMTAQVTVARLLSREDFAARYEDERPIHLHEFLYPLFQAQDSVALQTDVEMGGTDQTFNLLVGRDLQRAVGQEPQISITMPILVGTDGVQKMSKSLGNYIGITEPPAEMYGKLMSVSDTVMLGYYPLVSGLGPAGGGGGDDGGPGGAAPPHGREEAAGPAGRGALPRRGRPPRPPRRPSSGSSRAGRCRSDVREVDVPGAPAGSRCAPGRSWRRCHLAASASEARRLIQQGGIRIDGERVEDPYQTVGIRPGDTHPGPAGPPGFRPAPGGPGPRRPGVRENPLTGSR